MRTVVVGVGRMGRRHIQVVRSLGVDLVGVADVREESLAAAATEHQLSADILHRDPMRLLATTRPECVVIASTAPSHCGLVCAAAENGARFVLCEKPLAVSIAECDRMIEACARRGVLLAVNHQMRVMEQYTMPKSVVDAEEFGGLNSMVVAAGNFGLAMNGIHYFEAFRFLAGEPAHSVSAWFSAGRLPNPRGAEFEDRAGDVRVSTASGKTFYLSCGSEQGHGMQVVYSGRRGQLHVDELYGTTSLAVREATHRTLPTSRYGMPAVRAQGTIAPADAVAPTAAVMRALLAGGDYPTGEDGRAAVATLVAAYVSDEREHAPVLVDSTLPRDRIFPWA